jgi:hypothetical protein
MVAGGDNHHATFKAPAFRGCYFFHLNGYVRVDNSFVVTRKQFVVLVFTDKNLQIEDPVFQNFNSRGMESSRVINP